MSAPTTAKSSSTSASAPPPAPGSATTSAGAPPSGPATAIRSKSPAPAPVPVSATAVSGSDNAAAQAGPVSNSTSNSPKASPAKVEAQGQGESVPAGQSTDNNVSKENSNANVNMATDGGDDTMLANLQSVLKDSSDNNINNDVNNNSLSDGNNQNQNQRPLARLSSSNSSLAGDILLGPEGLGGDNHNDGTNLLSRNSNSNNSMNGADGMGPNSSNPDSNMMGLLGDDAQAIQDVSNMMQGFMAEAQAANNGDENMDNNNGMNNNNPFMNLAPHQKRKVPPVKLAFYEYLIRQLLDDGFIEEAFLLKARSGLQENLSCDGNFLYQMYEEGLGRGFGTVLHLQTVKKCLLDLTPVPFLDPQEKCLDVENPRFDLEGVDKITYTDSYKNVIADDDPESLAKAQAHSKGGFAAAQAAAMEKENGENSKDPPILTESGALMNTKTTKIARAIHRKKANIFNKVHYHTPHKQMVRCVNFSPDGRFAASGSQDTTVKVLDTQKMYSYYNSSDRRDQMNPNNMQQRDSDSRPVLRTLYDHVQAVNCVAFHPQLAYLFSGSTDKTVKIYDLTKPSTQLKALSSINDISPVTSMSLHPSGDFLYVGTHHPTIRLYDLTTLQCFQGHDPSTYHTAAILDLTTSSDGKVMASCSADGECKLWDVTDNRVVHTLTKPHMGNMCCSVKFSRNLNYMVTAGCDGKARLWDIRKLSSCNNGQEQPVYTMNVCSSKNGSLEYAKAAFVGLERYIAVASASNDLCILDSQSGEYLQGAVHQSQNMMNSGGNQNNYNNNRLMHSSPVYCIAAHPTEPRFLTGSDDHKVRYCEILNRSEEWVQQRQEDRAMRRLQQKGQGRGQMGMNQNNNNFGSNNNNNNMNNMSNQNNMNMDNNGNNMNNMNTMSSVPPNTNSLDTTNPNLIAIPSGGLGDSIEGNNQINQAISKLSSVGSSMDGFGMGNNSDNEGGQGNNNNMMNNMNMSGMESSDGGPHGYGDNSNMQDNQNQINQMEI